MDNTQHSDGNKKRRKSTHKLGDVVSLGEKSGFINHQVTSVRVANMLGGKVAQQIPNHVFVIVGLKIDNQSDELFRIRSSAYVIRDAAGGTYEPDTWADIFLEADDRIELESISFNHIDSGASKKGALIFDVPPENTIGLLIKSSDFSKSSKSRLIQLGTIET